MQTFHKYLMNSVDVFALEVTLDLMEISFDT